MPLALWLLLGGVAAYLVYQSGKTAAQSASALPAASSTNVLHVTDQAGNPYSVPVDPNLPIVVAQQIQQFFAASNSQSGPSVLALSNQLAAQGYTVAAGSVQSVWAMIQAASPAQGPLVQGGTSNGGAPAGGGGGFPLNPFAQSSSSASQPSLISAANVPTPTPFIKPG